MAGYEGVDDIPRDSDDDSRRDDDDDDCRGSRFVETEENPELFKSKSLNKLKPFYNGSVLENRMSEIRKSIYYIRHNWNEYGTFLVQLKQLLLEDGAMEFKDPTTRRHFDVLVSSKRDWLTTEQAQDVELGYEAVKLYTSKEGHERIYRLSNDIFRKEKLVSVETIRSLVFLVELINIDLYNYCLKCPERRNFEGVVYRGLCLSESDLLAFRSVREEPIGSRNIAVPLGLFSASASRSVAERFIKFRLKSAKADGKVLSPLLIKAHVIGLKPEHVEHYTSRFQAVLTTICAVDIRKLSRHQKEQEVLLRGPFMLILDFYQDENTVILGQTCSVLEVVMLNANRDHISSSSLGDLDTLARDLFATMVTVTRSEFATKYCEDKGLTQDAIEYQRIVEENRSKLKELMKQ